MAHDFRSVTGGRSTRVWALSAARHAAGSAVVPTAVAIRLHHDYSIFQNPEMPPEVCQLVAMGLLAELAIQRFAGLNHSSEWDKGSDLAIGCLMLTDQNVEDWVDKLLEDFSTGKA